MEILVIGAGVMGLSSAVLLERAGIRTRIWAREVAPNVTSCIAPAFWEPFRVEPEHLVSVWGRAAFAEFFRMAREAPETGILLRRGRSVFAQDVPDPWWHDCVPEYRRLSASELPRGYCGGFAWTTAIIETPIYMPWLMRQYERLGGTIERRRLVDLSEALAAARIVVNCSGLGARELVRDPAIYPSRGQLVRVEQFGLEEFFIDEGRSDGLAYIIPRSKDIILGGTAEDHVETLEPDAATADAIMRRCRTLVPRLGEAKVLGHLVGLRPRRSGVRLELERIGDRAIVHNYGHGGAGISLSWGCAQEVLKLVRQLL
jgi:D-amino-acid oxidase